MKRRQEETNIYEIDYECELIFSTNFDDRNLRMIELPVQVYNYINDGGYLTIKGQPTGKDAVLCTFNQTYEMKKIENSNTLFLVPPSDSTIFTIDGQTSSIYEVVFNINFLGFITIL
jgi:hypothetical protein